MQENFKNIVMLLFVFVGKCWYYDAKYRVVMVEVNTLAYIYATP